MINMTMRVVGTTMLAAQYYCLFGPELVFGFVVERITTTTTRARNFERDARSVRLGSRRDGSTVLFDEPTTSIATTTTTTNTSRRGVLLGASSAVAAATTFGLKTNDRRSGTVNVDPTTTASTTTMLSSVEDAVRVIDASCDRRFLHSVVASDYRLLYRGSTSSSSSSSANEPSDLLSPGTYGSASSTKAVEFFTALEGRMKNDPVRPSNGHLGTTVAAAAREWGGACSVWPLGENVHFAWLKEGGDFFPSNGGGGAVVRDATTLELVVDGVNCGVENLEDALRGSPPRAEILFRADEWLMVPESMEKDLVAAMKRSFLV